jgi:branched-subunit amino acid ABC-type transport system permease component
VSAGGWIALWAGFLAVLALLSIPFEPALSTPLLLGGAALGTLALALVAPRLPVRRLPPRSALAPIAFAWGVTLTIGGAEVGQWMLGIGIGLLVAAAALLMAERRVR